MRRMLAAIVLLTACAAAPVRADDAKAKPAKAAPPSKFTEADFVRLQLAQAQMNDADKAFALAQHAQTDAQRTYREAQSRLNDTLAKYSVRPEDLQAKVVTISDDGEIRRPAPASPPPAPAKPSKK